MKIRGIFHMKSNFRGLACALAALPLAMGCEVTTTVKSLDGRTSALSAPAEIQFLDQDMITGNDLSFQARGAGISSGAAYAWSYSLNGSTPCHSHPESDPSVFTVHCDNPGSLRVSLQITNPDGSVVSLSYSAEIAQNTAPAPVPSTAASLTFRVKAGTGPSPWNTMASEIELFVGQTLRVFNDDSINHQLHVDRFNTNADLNARPCAHQAAAMAPGGFYDCVVTKAYDPAIHPNIYDHLAGPNARFYLRAYDGAALYQNKCASCHNPLATSEVKNRSVTQISNALNSVSAMSSLKSMPAGEIRAISYILNK